jgi:hypothetical protein
MRDWITHLSWVTRQSWRSPFPVHAGLDFFPSTRHTTVPRLIVLHSTETTGFPGYNSGAAAPHFTIDLRSGEVRQHVPLSWGSRCLAVSAGGVRDATVNTSGVIQIETIGAVTPGYPAKHGHYDLVNTFPDDKVAHAHLARLLRAIHDETGIPLQVSSYARWVVYPGSYGAYAAQRLSSAQFRDARGIVGHQHAPGNDHGDGLYGRSVNGKAVDLENVLALARSGGTPAVKPAPAPPPRAPEVDPNKGFPMEHLERVESLLDVLGYDGADVWARVRAYQQDNNLTPDSLPGPQTSAHLEDTMTTLTDRLDRLEAKLDAALGRDPWAGRVPFQEGTSLHNTFGPNFRAGALLGYAAQHAYKQAGADKDEIIAEIRAEREEDTNV